MTMGNRTKISRILITGGCGFVGANLAKYFYDKGYDIKILDNLSTGTVHNLEDTGIDLTKIELIKGDVLDRTTVNRAVAGSNAIVHLAAETSVIDSFKLPVEHWNINVTGTLNLLEESRLNNRIKTFVFASSNAVLGEQEPPASENQLPQPLSPYGASKLACEALCTTYHHAYGLPTYCLRFSNCYGPFSMHKPSVISIFIQRLMENKPLVIYGDGNQTRDFIHIEDICQAIFLCQENTGADKNTSRGGEIFNIASGKETSINELVGLLTELTEKKSEVIHEPARKGEIIRNYSDISKVKRHLKYEPRIALKDGLADLWNWFDGKDK